MRFQKGSARWRISGTIFRPTVIRYVDGNGKRVSKDTPGAKRVREKSKTWRARYTDSEGRVKTRSLFDDRETSEAKLADILQREREFRAGIRRHDPFEVHRTTPLVCPKCVGAGCPVAAGKPTGCEANHLDGFRGHLEAKAGTEKHVTQTVNRIRKAFENCHFAILDDLDGGRLAGWLKDCRNAGLSPSTSNARLTALKTFGNWLLKDRRVRENPFAHVSRVNAKVDVRIVRRALCHEALARLIAAAEVSRPFRNLSGADRAILYLLAGFTGLRAAELSSLTERSLNFCTEPPTVILQAANSKHRQEDVLPLHPELATALQLWLQNRRSSEVDRNIIRMPERTGVAKQAAAEPLFPGTWPEKAAKMIRRDLKAARATWISEANSEAQKAEREDSDFLLFETDEGRADFHALRHMFITNLAGSGVHPKLAKELARHSTIMLTMDHYTHVGLLDMNAALESMPGIPRHPGEAERPVATGTTDFMVATMVAPEPVQPRKSQELSDASAQTKTARGTGRKLLAGEELPQPVITPEQVRAQGLEPWTYGLKVRC